MDHAFGFQTVDVRSNPTRIFIKFFFFFFFFFFSFFLFTYILVFFLGYFLIKYKILFTNFAGAEFECIFSFVSLLFISLLCLFLLAEEVYAVSLYQAKIMIIEINNKMKYLRNRSRRLRLSQNPHFYENMYM